MKVKFSITTLIALVVLLSSCSLLTGIKKPKTITPSQITTYAMRNGIPPEDCYELDNSFIAFLYVLQKKGLDKIMHDHYQPMQAMYFDSLGRMQSYHINCYANEKGVKLNWNAGGVMNQFPPLSAAPLDTFMTLDRQLKMIKPIGSSQMLNPRGYDWVVAIYWGVFTGKKSLSLVKAVKNNALLAGDKKIKIIYINNDNINAPGNNKKISESEWKSLGLSD